MSNWIYVKAVEDLAVYLLLFALLTACVVRWRRRKLAIIVLVVLVLLLLGTLAAEIGFLLMLGVDYSDLVFLQISWGIILAIGFVTVARRGWRCIDGSSPAAAAWPRLRMLLAVIVAVLLSVVTDWNLRLAVRQRLAREEVEASVMAMSATPSRPIDSQNAAIFYEPVFDRLMKANKDVGPADWTDFDKPLNTNDPKLRDFLASYQSDVTMLHRAAGRSHCYFERAFLLQDIDAFGSAGTHYGWHSPLIQAARLLAVDARVKLADGDLAGAASNTSAVFRMARHAAQDPGLIAILVSKAIDQTGVRCLQELLNHPDLSADVLSGLQLDGDVDYRRELRRAFVMEESKSIVLVKRAVDHGIRAMLEILGDAHAASPFGDFMWSIGHPYFIERELEVVRSLHRERRAALELPWPQARKRLDAMSESGTFREHGMMAATLQPALNEAVNAVMIGDARHRLARLAIAMRRYEFEHGNLPNSFDALMPEFIDDVPLDPFTEEPFKLESVDGGLRLYSEGVEALDREDRKTKKKVKAEMFLKTH